MEATSHQFVRRVVCVFDTVIFLCCHFVVGGFRDEWGFILGGNPRGGGEDRGEESDGVWGWEGG